MNAEIITTGTELLLGEITDTNAPFIARQLRAIGVNLYYKTTVGDNRERLEDVLRQGLSRNDVVIVTGGLGPTVDDITREAVSDATGRPLELRSEIVTHLEQFFGRRGRSFTKNNLRQAYLPKDAIMIPNPIGTAPGFIVETEQGTIITMPGVPREMERMMQEQVVPYLQQKMDEQAVIITRIIHTASIGESSIDDLIKDLMTSSNPTVGLAAHLGQVDIRLAARAATRKEAQAIIAPAEAAIREKLAPWIYGVDEDSQGSVIARWLRMKNATLAILETNTHGAILEKFPPQNRNVLVGHFQDITALSGCEDCQEFTEGNARAIAQSLRKLTGATLAMALIGSSDPNFGFWSEQRGESWLAVAMPAEVYVKHLGAAGDDDFTRNWLATNALAYIYRRRDDLLP
ncbi:MAG: competence/damage-inducible protein A [Clostridia bacterium]|nr:MAG: competence/damage-inducible protein A [Clostridia bacterium]